MVTTLRQVSALLLVASLALPGQALAAPSETARQAKAKFAEGQAAFKQGDYRHAGECFETAYKLKPHHDPLWNAARSWEAAGEAARAANLYERFLREAPPKSKDRNKATSFLKQSAERLGRLQITATGLTNLLLDRQPVEEGVVYVDPGEHLVRAHAGEQVVERSYPVNAGQTVSVVLKPPEAAPPPPPPLPPPVSKVDPVSPPTNSEPEIVEHREPRAPRWAQILVPVAGSLVTAAIGGTTVWSGLDTLNQKKVFDANMTQANLDAGKSKQLRTNILIGVTAGLGALTVVASALVLSDKTSTTTQVALGPGSLVVRGAF
jgi:hypothetical protein